MTFRELPPSEWPRLIADGIEPFCLHGLPDPAHWILLVAEEDGRILGCSSLVETVQNHWFVHPDVRRRSITLVTGLWRATKATLDEHQVPVIHTTVPTESLEVQGMLEGFGFVPADGTLLVLDVSQAALNERIG